MWFPTTKVPIFKTAGSSILPGRMVRGQPMDTSEYINPEIKTITSTKIQLSGIPDKLIICVRKVIGNMK